MLFREKTEHSRKSGRIMQKPTLARRVRGKCPLELAGYDVSAIPLARLLAAQPPDNGSDPLGADGVPTA
jgi:hypothetical protein